MTAVITLGDGTRIESTASGDGNDRQWKLKITTPGEVVVFTLDRDDADALREELKS